MRILFLLIMSIVPIIVFTGLLVWAIGTFAYAPLAPLSQKIGTVAAPYVQPILQWAKNLLNGGSALY
jgi:hypothetical protein